MIKSSTHLHVQSNLSILLYLRHLICCFVGLGWSLQLNSERILSLGSSVSPYPCCRVRAAGLYLTNEAKGRFKCQLNDAFVSDSYSDIAKAWNEERLRVQEALDQHLIPVGTKWCQEWLREEVEDALAIRCSNKLKEVCWLAFIHSCHSQGIVADGVTPAH